MLLWWVTTALAGDCRYVDFNTIVDIEAPAILVMGERHGHQPDLRRAGRVVKALLAEQPVWVSLEAVHRDDQQILNNFANDLVSVQDLPAALDWEEAWGFPWGPYKGLVTAANWGATVIAAGVDLGPKPDDVDVPVPPRYIDLLRDAMGGHDMPLGMEGRFVSSMAWRDHAIAKASLDRWKERGFLVIVAGRGHVEGSKGINWQLQQLTRVPVYSVILAEGPEAPCYPGDRIWR